MERVTMKIDGMTCGHCVGQVSKALTGLDGVSVERVGIGSATVAFDPRTTSEAKITEAIEDQGYSVAATAR